MHDDFRFSHHCILDTFQQQLHEHPSVPIEISRCMVISDMALSDVGVRPTSRIQIISYLRKACCALTLRNRHH